MRNLFRVLATISLSLIALVAVHHLCVTFLGNNATKFGDLFNEEEIEFRDLTTEQLLDEYKTAHREAKQIADGKDATSDDSKPKADANEDPIAEWHNRMGKTFNKNSKRRDQIKAELLDREAEKYLYRMTFFWGFSGFTIMALSLCLHVCRSVSGRCFDLRLVGLLVGGLGVLAWAVMPTSAYVSLSQTSLFAGIQASFSLVSILLIWIALKPNGLIDKVE